jgi:tRNA pseudouridine38-40 synthase
MPIGVLFTVQYDGCDFSGIAPQTNARTVGGELLGAIREIDPRSSALRITSRTDAGVHARGQLVAFDSDKDISPRGWLLGVTRHLPKEIAIVQAARVPAGFDPRGHVVRKAYRYVLLKSHVRDAFLEGRAWRVFDRLNQLAMRDAALPLIGSHDFAAFRGAADTREDTVRRLFRVDLEPARNDERILEIHVEGDHFLYHMVRIIAGTLVDIGRGRRDPACIARALENGKREELGITAPPDGLFLDAITLDCDLEERWPA